MMHLGPKTFVLMSFYCEKSRWKMLDIYIYFYGVSQISLVLTFSEIISLSIQVGETLN